MAHYCTYHLRIKLEKGELVKVVKALYGEYSLDIYKEYENGKAVSRNIHYSTMGGYRVNFPGERVYYTYISGTYIMPLEKWSKYKSVKFSGCNSGIDYIKLAESRPDLKYILKKWEKTKSTDINLFLKIIQRYKTNPEIEPLIELKQYSLAFNNQLCKLTAKKKKEVVNFVKENYKDNEDMQLKQIFQCLNYKIPYCDIEEYNDCLYAYHYLKRKNINARYYLDYIGMCEKIGKDLTDPYWLYPNDIVKAHDKVMIETSRIKEVNKYGKNIKIQRVVEDLLLNNEVVNGYDIRFPNSWEEIFKHANELGQCLITRCYDEKMIKQKSILVFICKEGQAVATAEITYGKKILEISGNQRKKNSSGNFKPTQEVQEAFNSWLGQAVIKKKNIKKGVMLYEQNQDYSSIQQV